ncbi:hypothetical protein [Burkholderia cepacia]|nr:hypothetical protein [Burkholderia cepacia]
MLERIADHPINRIDELHLSSAAKIAAVHELEQPPETPDTVTHLQ